MDCLCFSFKAHRTCLEQIHVADAVYMVFMLFVIEAGLVAALPWLPELQLGRLHQIVFAAGAVLGVVMTALAVFGLRWKKPHAMLPLVVMHGILAAGLIFLNVEAVTVVGFKVIIIALAADVVLAYCILWQALVLLNASAYVRSQIPTPLPIAPPRKKTKQQPI